MEQPRIPPTYDEPGARYEGQYLMPPDQDLQHDDEALPYALGSENGQEQPAPSNAGAGTVEKELGLDDLDAKILNEK